MNNAHAKEEVMSAEGKRLAEASEWFTRLREEPVSSEAVEQWLQWCTAHPDNFHTYKEVQKIWSLARDAGVAEWPDPEEVRQDDYTGDRPVSEWLSQAQRSVAVEPGHSPRTRSWSYYAMAAAATVLLALGMWRYSVPWIETRASNVYSAERGAQRRIRLEDGSLVTLGGASRIRVDYREARRNIWLESGEAHFEVERDASRPFVVTSSNLRVTAIGTAFTVRADDARTVVSVTEGVVEVAPVTPEKSDSRSVPLEERERAQPSGAEDAASAVLRAKAGEGVAYGAHMEAPMVLASTPSMAIGWQSGTLVHVDEPLRSVVARINRYSKKEVVLADERLGELRFTGTVFENQVEEWAVGLERVFPIRAVEGSDGTLILAERE
jgi:transmembrane sensor